MDATMHRLLAAAAIAGGALRVVNAFTANAVGAQVLQVSYAVTDIFLLLGLAGILLTWRSELEKLGYAGVAVAAIGLTIIRGTAFSSLAMSGYAIGAAVALIGVALLAADLQWRKIGSRLPPYFWLAAFALGVWSAFSEQAALSAMAGIAFGAGFVASGIDLLFASHRAVPAGST
jgi:hypothetical protein